MARGAVFTTQSAAAAFEADVSLALGYPKNSVDMGPGPHAPSAVSRTVRWDVPRKHPTKNEWCVTIEAAIDFLCTAAGEALVVPTYLTKTKYDAMKAKVTASGELPADWRTGL